MQSMFHELVEDTMIGSSGLDLTLNDSGFVDGQDGLQALESLMGAAPKIGANYSYAPAGSLSEEHLGAEHIHHQESVRQDLAADPEEHPRHLPHLHAHAHPRDLGELLRPARARPA